MAFRARLAKNSLVLGSIPVVPDTWESTAMIADNLSRRLRQTLACLLDGDTEKCAARRLGISPSTLHVYVTMLYRHFGVTSRSELLVHCLPRYTTRVHSPV